MNKLSFKSVREAGKDYKASVAVSTKIIGLTIIVSRQAVPILVYLPGLYDPAFLLNLLTTGPSGTRINTDLLKADLINQSPVTSN